MCSAENEESENCTLYHGCINHSQGVNGWNFWNMQFSQCPPHNQNDPWSNIGTHPFLPISLNFNGSWGTNMDSTSHIWGSAPIPYASVANSSRKFPLGSCMTSVIIDFICNMEMREFKSRQKWKVINKLYQAWFNELKSRQKSFGPPIYHQYSKGNSQHQNNNVVSKQARAALNPVKQVTLHICDQRQFNPNELN